VLYALADPSSDPRLLELVSGPIRLDAEVAQALSLLRISEGLKKARETLEGYASTALAELDNLEPSSARDALVSLTNYVVARTQ